MSFKNINLVKKIVIALLLSLLMITLTASFTYERMYSKMYIDASGFEGTYLINNSKMIEYLCIMNDEDISSKNTYLKYSQDETSVVKGKCNKTNSNYVTLFDEDNNVLSTLIFLTGEYILIENGKEPIKITKISNEAIVPNEET